MNGKDRANFIQKVTRDHGECRETYRMGAQSERLVSLGQMAAFEMAAQYAGLETLAGELRQLRERDCQ